MSDTRPEYVTCALTGVVDENKTWCGRHVNPSIEWMFQDAGHAALNARNAGRLVLCPECRNAIIKTLQEHGA